MEHKQKEFTTTGLVYGVNSEPVLPETRVAFVGTVTDFTEAKLAGFQYPVPVRYNVYHIISGTQVRRIETISNTESDMRVIGRWLPLGHVFN